MVLMCQFKVHSALPVRGAIKYRCGASQWCAFDSLNCNALSCIAMNCHALYCFVMHYNALSCIVLRCQLLSAALTYQGGGRPPPIICAPLDHERDNTIQMVECKYEVDSLQADTKSRIQ